MTSLLTIQHTVAGDTVTIRLAGKMQSLDLPLVQRIFEQAEARNPSRIDLDLANLDHLDSSGLGFLAARYKHFLDRKIDLRLSHVHPTVRKLLKLTNLDRLLIVNASEDELPRLKQREQLWESYEYAQSIMSGLGNGLLGLDCDGRVIYANPPAEQLLGLADVDLYEKPFSDLIASEQEKQDWDAARILDKPQRRAWLHLRRGGDQSFESVVFATHVRHGNQRIGTLIGITDSLELERTREALRTTEQRLQLIAASASDALLLYDVEGHLSFANPAAERLLGYSRLKLEALEWSLLAAPRHRELWERAWSDVFGGRTVQHEELLLHSSDGKERWCSVSGTPVVEESGQRVGSLFSLRDIDERYRMAQRLRMLESMEAVGRLAGGLARDFDQVLTREHDQLTALKGDLGAGHPMHGLVAEMLHQNTYMRHLVDQMGASQQRSDRTRQRIGISEVVQQVLDQLKARIQGRIQVRTDFPADAAHAQMVPGDLNDILHQVCLNAIEAVGDHGSLTLTSLRAHLDPVAGEVPASRPAGDFLCLSVEDTGKGIAPEVRARVFEPFFTTKAPGLGVGTGLSIVYGLIRQNDGWVEISSEPGQFTRVDLYLPLSGGVAPAAAGASPKRSGRPHGGELLLVVDDEPLVLNFTSAYLEHMGYRTLKAASGREGIEAFTAKHGEIQLVILDISLPDMNGVQLLDQLIKIDPGVRAILSSGMGVDAISEAADRPAVVGALEKPYRGEQLAKLVRKVLDERLAAES